MALVLVQTQEKQNIGVKFFSVFTREYFLFPKEAKISGSFLGHCILHLQGIFPVCFTYLR